MTRWLVVDTETGGLDPERHPLYTVGAAVLDLQEGHVAGIEIPVREPAVPDPDALRVNRIDPEEHLKSALHPVDAVNALETFALPHFPDGPITIAGYNVAFDTAFLRRLYRLADLRFEDRYSHRTVDLYAVYAVLSAAGLLPAINRPSLEAIAHAIGIEPEQPAHSALADAITTARCLLTLVERLKRPVIAGLQAVRDWADMAGKPNHPIEMRLVRAGMACGGADILQLLTGRSHTLDRLRLEAIRVVIRATAHTRPDPTTTVPDDRRGYLALSLLRSGWPVEDVSDVLRMPPETTLAEARVAADRLGLTPS